MIYPNRRKAAALRYNQEQEYAPKVSASGQGYIADTINETAKESIVPIIDDASLVELCAELNINETIPEDVYQAVAEVFAFVYRAVQQIGSVIKRKNIDTL